MLFIKIFRFLRGYVYFSGDEGFPERFINLCAGEKISLWDIESHSGKIYGKTDINGYKKIRKPSKKASTKIHIVKKVGVPFFINKNRDRKFLIFGLIAFIISIVLLSNTVWCIQVTGNEKVPEEKIIGVLSDLGLERGVRVSKLDRKEIALEARDILSDLSWISVNVEGCTATVEVKEKIEHDEAQDNSTIPSNIVASSDGELLYIETYRGTQIQKIGSGVVKGDVIITGIVEYKNTATNFYHSEGYVEAKTKKEISVSNKNVQGYKYKKIKKSYRLLFLGLSIPITPIARSVENSHSFINQSYLEIANVKLPFGIERKTVSIYEKSVISHPLVPVTNLICRQTNDLSHLEILDRKIFPGKNTLKAEYTCRENIAIQGNLSIIKP